MCDHIKLVLLWTVSNQSGEPLLWHRIASREQQQEPAMMVLDLFVPGRDRRSATDG